MLSMGLLRAVGIVGSIGLLPCSAERVRDFSDALQSGAEAVDGLAAVDGFAVHNATGMVLRERYVLREFLERRRHGATPGSSFPSITRREFRRGAAHLGRGSFGDVWKAFDTKLQKDVAVKIFYKETRSGAKYLTWKDANYNQKAALKANAQECKLVKDILQNSYKNSKGASRICACYAEHVLDARNTDKAAFLVQEMCGKSLTQHYLSPHTAMRTQDVREARKIVRQILEGLSFLQEFQTPLIHHDLKPDNVCVSNQGAKIIDWGGLVFGTPQAMYEPFVATPMYTPPESDQKFARSVKAFQMPVHSYDVYAAGLMYMQMLCPSMDDRKWFYGRPLTEAKVKTYVTQACRKLSGIDGDLKLIGRMIDRTPKSRPAPMALLEEPILAGSSPKPAVLPARPVVPVKPVIKPEPVKPTPVKPVVRPEPVKPVVKPEPVKPVVKPEPAVAASFAKGDLVEYWSPTFNKWFPCIIVRVHPDGKYDLDHENGQPLRNGATEDRIRKQGLKFKAGDAVEYKFSEKVWLRGEILRVDAASGTYAVQYVWNGETFKRYRVDPKAIRAPLARIDDANRPKPGAYVSQFVAKPGGDDSPLQPNVVNPIQEQGGGGQEDDAAYVLGNQVELKPVKVRSLSRGCDIIAIADAAIKYRVTWDKFLLSCGPQTKVMQMTRKYQITAKAEITLDKADPFIGQTCSVQALVTLGSGKKVRSAAQEVIPKAPSVPEGSDGGSRVFPLA